MNFNLYLHPSGSLTYRFSGTIVGVGDNSSSGWANSEWRSLKVYALR